MHSADHPSVKLYSPKVDRVDPNALPGLAAQIKRVGVNALHLGIVPAKARAASAAQAPRL